MAISISKPREVKSATPQELGRLSAELRRSLEDIQTILNKLQRQLDKHDERIKALE